MKVIVSAYLEDGVLTVHVIRIQQGEGSGTCEILNADGSWKTSSIYQRDPEGQGFPIPEEMTRKIKESLSA